MPCGMARESRARRGYNGAVMKYGMVRVGAFTPIVKVGDTEHNAEAVLGLLSGAHDRGVEIAVFPELCITGYTAADLFFTRGLTVGAVAAVKRIAAEMPENMIAFVGAPIAQGGRLFNCAVALTRGNVLGVVPKTEIPDHGEFYESRYFASASDCTETCECLDAPMGNVLFKCKEHSGLTVGCEICEDMWTDVPPSVFACRAGATVIVNLSASDETVGKAEYRELLVKSASGRMNCAYVYADAGYGESSTDMVFSGHNMIAENGNVLECSKPFGGGVAVADVDTERIDVLRRKTGLKTSDRKFRIAEFSLAGVRQDGLCRRVEKYPFVPSGAEAAERVELILTMQAAGLKKRVEAARAASAVVGVSGGLDSTLALIAAVRAVGRDKVTAVTMPCFGTTEKTLGNAEKLCKALGVKLIRIDIKDTVNSHLKDINHDKKDVVYENAQARVRTLTLFDIANRQNGVVVGTGDMSELALGWATYNGDHMSSYGVNAGIPKTLVKFLVRHVAESGDARLRSVLNDIADTDISPELLPPTEGKIAQKTEDILGKYDLLDFILYYFCSFGFTRGKIAYLLGEAFGETPEKQRNKALDTFFGRFFAAQFKRSCLPDGVKIGSVSLSPRSDFRLPSDAEFRQ